jgi:hypothetical protein
MPNKITQIQREFVQNLLDKQQTKIKRELNKLTGKEYISVVISLMEFVVPKLSRSESEKKLNEITTIRVIRVD